MSSAYALKAVHERNMPALRIWATGATGTGVFAYWLPLQGFLPRQQLPARLPSPTISKGLSLAGSDLEHDDFRLTRILR
jgi:hypothetical protein